MNTNSKFSLLMQACTDHQIATLYWNSRQHVLKSVQSLDSLEVSKSRQQASVATILQLLSEAQLIPDRHEYFKKKWAPVTSGSTAELHSPVASSNQKWALGVNFSLFPLVDLQRMLLAWTNTWYLPFVHYPQKSNSILCRPSFWWWVFRAWSVDHH